MLEAVLKVVKDIKAIPPNGQERERERERKGERIIFLFFPDSLSMSTMTMRLRCIGGKEKDRTEGRRDFCCGNGNGLTRTKVL